MTRQQRRPARVSEPVQVYLDPADQERLERLAAQLAATKSDVLRSGLAALEKQLLDPAAHPALRIIGIARGPAAPEADPGYDVAIEHDRYLGERERASWDADEGADGG